MPKIILTLLAITGLGLTLIPSILVFAGSLSFETHRTLMLIGFVLWFLVAPFWMRKG